MKAKVLLMLLVLIVAPVAGYHEGIGGRNPPNRAPIADAGPDQIVAESSVIVLDASKSFDPDPDDNEDLAYFWTVQTYPRLLYDPDGDGPLAPQVSPVPLQIAQECIVEDQMELDLDLQPFGLMSDKPLFAFHAPYIPPGVPAEVEIVVRVTIYDRENTTVDGLYPIGLPVDVDKDGEDDYEHGWTGEWANPPTDTIPIWHTTEENETALRNQTNHRTSDEVRIIVRNTNQPPHGDIYLRSGNVRSLCDEPHYIDFGMGAYLKDFHDQFAAPDPDVDTSLDMDLWENRFDHVQFEVQAWDDQEVGVVEVYLYHEDDVRAFEKERDAEFLCQIDDVQERIRFGLGRHFRNDTPHDFGPGAPGTPGEEDDYPLQLYRGQVLNATEHQEIWRGRLPISTPALVEGTYRVCARAFDKMGAWQIADPSRGELSISESLEKGQSPPCMSLFAPEVQPAITPPVPERLPAAEPIKKFDCTYPKPSTANCDTFPPQPMGPGNLLRLDVAMKPRSVPGDEEYVPETAFLLEKVVFQNEIITSNGTMLGPNTTISYPYVINLDTLALDTRRIYVRAYDRVGGVTEMCVRVTPDNLEPQVLTRAPDTVYPGIPAEWVYYVQDLHEVESVQTIKQFGFGGADVRTNRTTGDDGTLTLPALAAFPHFDITGDGHKDALIDMRVLTDPSLAATPDKWNYGHYWDYEEQGLGVLSSGRCDQDRYTDFFIDEDGRRGCGADDIQRILGADRTKEPTGLAPSLKQTLALEPTDVALRNYLGRGQTHVLVHEVTPDDVEFGTYTWVTLFADEANNIIPAASGKVRLTQYFTDVEVTKLELKDPYIGRLPGDAVNLTGRIEQVDGLEDIEIVFGYAWNKDAGKSLEGLVGFDASAEYSRLIRRAEILVHQCLETGRLAPCALEVGDHQNVTLNRTDFAPGVHEVTLKAFVPPEIVENVTDNNVMTAKFEIYLGRVDVGKDQYFVRAGNLGMPRLDDGVINLKTNQTYDLELSEWMTEEDVAEGRGARTVYTFQIGNDTYYWDPVERRDPANPKEVCHFQDSTFTSACRPITVFEEAAPVPESKATPGIGLLALVALLISGVVLARRRP